MELELESRTSENQLLGDVRSAENGFRIPLA